MATFLRKAEPLHPLLVERESEGRLFSSPVSSNMFQQCLKHGWCVRLIDAWTPGHWDQRGAAPNLSAAVGLLRLRTLGEDAVDKLGRLREDWMLGVLMALGEFSLRFFSSQ